MEDYRMPHVAPWYRPEDYARIREIMDDGDRMPRTFDEWERIAKDQLATAAAKGIDVKTRSHTTPNFRYSIFR